MSRNSFAGGLGLKERYDEGFSPQQIFATWNPDLALQRVPPPPLSVLSTAPSVPPSPALSLSHREGRSGGISPMFARRYEDLPPEEKGSCLIL